MAQVAQGCARRKGQREGGLAARVYTPERATWASFESAYAAWQRYVLEYMADGRKQVAEDAKVNAIKALVPLDLKKQIQDQGDRLNNLASLEKFIGYQLASRKEAIFEGGIPAKPC